MLSMEWNQRRSTPQFGVSPELVVTRSEAPSRTVDGVQVELLRCFIPVWNEMERSPRLVSDSLLNRSGQAVSSMKYTKLVLKLRARSSWLTSMASLLMASMYPDMNLSTTTQPKL